MRIKLEAKHFQVGMIAFLPYWGKLRKAKITKFDGPYPTLDGNKCSVTYRPVTGLGKDAEFMCIMSENSVYEVWSRKLR